MTDQSLPGEQLKARWRSGNPTLATSGGAFVNGDKWGALDGALAVACLKASRVLFLTFDGDGKLQKVRAPRALRQYGRIRQVVQRRERRPAGHHRQRRRQRRDPAGPPPLRALRRPSRRPVEERLARR